MSADDGVERRRPRSDDAIWAAIVGPLLTARAAAELLGVDEEAVRSLERARRILALRIGDVVGYPSAQLADGRVLPGVAEVLDAMPRAEMADVVFWLLAPGRDGEREIDLLRAGDVTEVLRHARHDAALDDG